MMLQRKQLRLSDSRIIQEDIVSAPHSSDMDPCAWSVLDLAHTLANVKTLIAVFNAGDGELGASDQQLLALLEALLVDVRRAGEVLLPPVGDEALVAMADQIAAHLHIVDHLRARWLKDGDVLRLRLVDAVGILIIAPATVALQRAAKRRAHRP